MNLSMKYSIGLYGVLCLLAGLSGCEELDHSISEDPYGGGKVQFGLRLLSEDPVPAKGYPGDTVVFKADGLLDYCVPEKGEYAFKFYLGEQETKILAAKSQEPAGKKATAATTIISIAKVTCLQ